MMNLNILFIPFDAAIQHYKRNAVNGVKARRHTPYNTKPPLMRRSASLQSDPGFQQWFSTLSADQQAHMDSRLAGEFLDSHRFDEEATKQFMDAATISAKLPDIIKHICISMQDSPDTFPDVIFLSEQPKGVDFPSLTTHSPYIILSSDINYTHIGGYMGEGTDGKQRIFVYVRNDSFMKGRWTATPLMKTSAAGAEEHPVMVKFENEWGYFNFLGVHLSSKNTGLKTKDSMQPEIENLYHFCLHHEIDIALGDFNMNMQEFTHGSVGIIPKSTVYFAHPPGVVTPPPPEMEALQHFSNSVDDAHYMGFIVIAPTRVIVKGTDAESGCGASGPRSLPGQGYFSDHPPIGVKVDFKPRNKPLMLTWPSTQ